jgi:hypothetical protein
MAVTLPMNHKMWFLGGKTYKKTELQKNFPFVKKNTLNGRTVSESLTTCNFKKKLKILPIHYLCTYAILKHNQHCLQEHIALNGI